MGKSDNAIHFWDKAAGFYTIVQEGMNRKLYHRTYALLRPLFNSTDIVFEMAAGTGQFASALAFSAGEWIATDFSAKMVERICFRRRTCAVL